MDFIELTAKSKGVSFVVKVSPEDAHLGKYSLGMSGHGYPRIYIDKKYWYLHKYLLEAPKGLIIDHIDGNRLNATRQNLRVATHSLNTHNRSKTSKVTHSKYVGVNRDKGKWRAEALNTYLGQFETEDEAAAAYNYAVTKAYGQNANLNDTPVTLSCAKAKRKRDCNDGCIRYNKKTNNYSAHLTKYKQKYYFGTFTYEQDARKAINDKLYELEQAKPLLKIERNADGIAILKAKLPKLFVYVDILVDDDIYIEYQKKKLLLSPGGYTCTGKHLLHRLIMDAKKYDIVDHKLGNLNDLRRNSLRIANFSENSHNQKKRQGCTSSYKGVSKTKQNTWKASIRRPEGGVVRKIFVNEIEAAIYYDKIAKDIYGDVARVNFITYPPASDVYSPMDAAVSYFNDNKMYGCVLKLAKGWQARTCFDKQRFKKNEFATREEAVEWNQEKYKELYCEKHQIDKEILLQRLKQRTLTI